MLVIVSNGGNNVRLVLIKGKRVVCWRVCGRRGETNIEKSEKMLSKENVVKHIADHVLIRENYVQDGMNLTFGEYSVN
jgi:hypothetical protein